MTITKNTNHTVNIIMNKLLFLLFFLLFSISNLSANEDELLSPDDAFSASLSLASSDKLKATWDIADGYYMYRKRFSFESATPGITLGEPIFPKGKIKDDPGFGSVEVYRHQVSAVIPIVRGESASKALSFDLKTKSQGCADIGVCYPPQKKTLAIQLAAVTPINSSESPEQIAKSSVATKKTFDLAKELGIAGLGDSTAPLPPDEAFAYDIIASDKQNLLARWDITEGHYLYQHKIKFSLVDPPNGVTLSKPNLPKGKAEHDQYFGDIVTYNESFDVKVPIIGKADKLTVKTTYQGCSKLTGICYPPQHKTETINLATAVAVASTVTNSENASINSIATSSTEAPNTSDEITLSNTQSISTGNSFLDKSLGSNSLWSIFLAALGAGLLLAFTACMYPMIPILSSIIVGQGENVSMMKGLTLSSVYVLALAVTFGIVGAITASVAGGIGVQAYFQNPWVLSAFALLFVLLAMSMFGFYDIQIPAKLQNKLTNLSNNQKGGSFIGVAIMGALSALIIGPCGGPVLAAMLGYAAASASMVKGFAALFALGLGMGLPLLIVGAGGGKLLPKAGNWMTAVKAAAGVILLAVSLVILERMPHLFPPGLTMFLWSLLLIVSGVYMGAFSSKDGASGWSKLWKGLGLAAVFFGALVMFGGQMGGQSVTDPLYGIKSGTVGPASGGSANSALEKLSFKKIKSSTDLRNEILAAKKQGKAVMLDFYADWCTYCIQYERYVFPQPSVREYLDKMVLLKADVTDMDKIDEELMKVLGVSLPPAILFFGSSGKEIPNSRILGEMNAKEFTDHLAKFSN